MESEKSRVKNFTGRAEEWHGWHQKFQAYLNGSGGDLLSVFSTTRPTGGAKEAAWLKKNQTIYWKLILYTDGAANGLVEQFGSEQDGVGAWKALKTKYEPQGTIDRIALRTKLMRRQLREGEDPDDCFIDMERMQTQLERLGRKVDDEDMMGIVLDGLPSGYARLRTVLDADDDLSYEMVKKKVRGFYKREIARQEKEASALITMISGPCYGCGERGHRKVNCPKKKMQGSGGNASGGGGGNTSGGGRGAGTDGIKCFRCGNMGHKHFQCRAKVSDDGEAMVAGEDYITL
jgi:hypothetical protein